MFHFRGLGNVWIGLNDKGTEGKWVWIDQIYRSATYRYFNSGEPNNSGDCGQMYTSGKWDDTGCSNQMNFICLRGSGTITTAQPTTTPVITTTVKPTTKTTGEI